MVRGLCVEWESGHSLARWRRTNETYRDSRSSISKSTITIRARYHHR